MQFLTNHSVLPVFVYLVALFFLAFLLGRKFCKADAWDYVDTIYYPLAAIGVALLFVNSSAQRQLLELTQLEETHKNALEALIQQRPDVRVAVSEDFVRASFGIVETIPQFANACRYPGNIDPRCTVAEKIKMPVDEFLAATHSASDQPIEIRLSTACRAADALILSLQNKERMSSLISDELIFQYKEAVAKGLPYFSLEPLKGEIDTFEKRAGTALNMVRAVLRDNSEASKFVTNMYLHEIEFGKLLLQGLQPCITSERGKLEALTNWTRKRQTQDQQVADVKANFKRVNSAGPAFPALAFIQLSIWPYILIIALALKFSKGIASVTKN